MKKQIIFEETDDVLKRISITYDTMSKNHKIIADYIREHLEKAAYMTIHVLSESTQTSVSTVLRLTYLLGYEGYPQFRRALKNQLKNKLTTIQRIHMPGFEDYSVDMIKQVMALDIQNIKLTVEELDTDTFTTCIKKLIECKRIYVIGSRTTAALVDYMYYYLNLLLNGKVYNVQDSITMPYEQMMNMDKDDVAIVMSFPRYSVKTMQYLNFCKSKNPTIIGITDSKSSPMYGRCDYMLYAKSNIVSFVDTLVAPLSLINAIIVGVGLMNKPHTEEVLKELENLWIKNVTYGQIK